MNETIIFQGTTKKLRRRELERLIAKHQRDLIINNVSVFLGLRL